MLTSSRDARFRSELRPGLGGGCLLSWVVVAWIVELAVVVLVVEVLSNGVGDSQEVLHVDGVANVGVEVVLEVLQHVHVVVYEWISPHSGERERVVVQLPRVHLQLWGSARLSIDGRGDVLDVGPVSRVKSSAEHVDLIVEFVLGFVEVLASWLVDLDEGLLIRAGAAGG